MSEDSQSGTTSRTTDVAGIARRVGQAVGIYALLLLGVGLVLAGAGEVAHLLGFSGSQRRLIRVLMLLLYGAVFLGLKKRR